MIHSAIFVVKMPNDTEHSKWLGFLGDVDGPLRSDKSASRLSENVWFLDMQTSVRTFAELVIAAEQRGLTYGILQLDAAPQWLPAGFDPTSIEGHNAVP